MIYRIILIIGFIVNLLIFMFGIFESKKNIISISLIIFVVIYKGWKAVKRSENRNKTFKDDLNDFIDTCHKINVEFKKEPLLSIQAKQVFESIYLIETTRNIDVLISRYEFACKILTSKSISNSALNEGLKIYSSMYYDRELSLTQSNLSRDNYTMINQEYLEKNILDCFLRYASFEEYEINELKTQKAKKNRVFKIQTHAETCILNCFNQKYKDIIKSRLRDFEKYC